LGDALGDAAGDALTIIRGIRYVTFFFLLNIYPWFVGCPCLSEKKLEQPRFLI
jgi:hypothetical protein